MSQSLTLTKVGGKCKAVINGSTTKWYVTLTDCLLKYNANAASSHTVNMSIREGQFLHEFRDVPIASVSIAGAVITDEATFDTKVALVFT